MALRGFSRPVRYIILFFLLNSVISIANFMQVQGTPVHGQLLWNPFHLLTSLATYPLLFAYLFDLMRPGTVRLRYWLSVYVPLAILVALHIIFSKIYSPLPLFTQYADILAHTGAPELWVRFAATVMFAVMSGAYIAKSIGMLRQHLRELMSNFSYTEGVTLMWIWWFLSFTLLKVVAVLLVMSVEGKVIKTLSIVFFSIEHVITTIWVLRQKTFYVEPAAQPDSSCETVSADSKKNAFELSPEKRDRLRQDLKTLLEKEEAYKDPELSVDKICEMLATNRTYLSLVINGDMNTTFYRVINTCRLHKAQSMMRDPLYRHTSLKSIAAFCGFKSLTSFGQFFRQECGKTPTEWREEQEV
jgi:AraC-like DNA-binding protein